MKEKDIRKVLSYLGSYVTSAQDRPGWLIASCPFAHWRHDGGKDNHPSFGVDLKDKKHRYHCFSCNSSGRLAGLPEELIYLNQPKKLKWQKQTDSVAGLDLAKAAQLIAQDAETLTIDVKSTEEIEAEKYKRLHPDPWPEWWLESFKSVEDFPEALAYLAGRGVPEAVWRPLDLRYDTTRQRVCFPIRDWSGALTGLHGRIIVPGGSPPYHAYGYKNERNPIVWLGEHWLDVDKPVLLVESVFDLASVLRVYQNSACSLSSGLSKDKIKRIDQFPRVVTLYDNGKGGDAARAALTKYLVGAKPRHYLPTQGVSDPGEMTEAQLREVLHKKGLPGV